METVVLAFGLFIFVAHLLREVFRRVRVPDILLLILLGVLAGPVLGWIQVEQLGRVGDFLGVATLVVILFESGLGLDGRSVLAGLRRAVPFAIGGFVVTVAALAGVMAWWLIDVPLWTAILGGFILGGTSSSVVIPIIQGVGASEETTTTLTLESALTDVLCIVGAIGIATGLAGGDGVQTGALLGQAATSLGVAVVFGVAAAAIWSLMLGMVAGLRETMSTTLAFALIVYGAGESMGLSGAIAALTLGVVFGNLRGGEFEVSRKGSNDGAQLIRLATPSGTERRVYAEVVFLLKACFFFYLGMTIRPGDFLGLHGLAALALAVTPFIVRYPFVRFLLPASTTRREAMLAWAMAPRGLAAAVLATIPVRLGIPGAADVAVTVNMMVALSITIVAVLVFVIERGTLTPIAGTLLAGFDAGGSEPSPPASPEADEPAPTAVPETAPPADSPPVADANDGDPDPQPPTPPEPEDATSCPEDCL